MDELIDELCYLIHWNGYCQVWTRDYDVLLCIVYSLSEEGITARTQFAKQPMGYKATTFDSNVALRGQGMVPCP